MVSTMRPFSHLKKQRKNTTRRRKVIYTSNRIISSIESQEILKEIKSFVGSWQTHQKSLNADGTILLDRCLVFAVDEEIQSISGCSIDSSVKFVKSIGQKYNIDFFNRLNILLLKDEKPLMVSYHELNNYKDAYLFNPNVETLAIYSFFIAQWALKPWIKAYPLEYQYHWRLKLIYIILFEEI